MQVKISDNALARDLFPMDYHCLGDNENRPVRWMALESLLHNDFSSLSDVVTSFHTHWEGLLSEEREQLFPLPVSGSVGLPETPARHILSHRLQVLLESVAAVGRGL